MAPDWLEPPAALGLLEDEVHVWSLALEQPDEEREALARALSEDERQRAARFYFEKDRRHFTVARGVLRALLGRYLERAPGEISFEYGPQGKPSLPSPAPLRFNLSHSGGRALLAFSREREVGVDIEQARPLKDLLGLAETVFSPRELATLRALSGAAREEAFFACWSRKEAFIKATGEGMSRRLDSFDVSLRPGEAARLLHVEGEPPGALRWELRALPELPGYGAALVITGLEAERVRLRCWRWVRRG